MQPSGDRHSRVAYRERARPGYGTVRRRKSPLLGLDLAIEGGSAREPMFMLAVASPSRGG